MGKFLQFCIKTLAPTHPLRLSLAIIVGLNLDVILEVSMPFMNPFWRDIVGKVGELGCISFSVMLFFLPLAFRSNRLSEDIEQKFAVIRRAAEEGQLTKVQRRLLYLQLARFEISNRSLQKNNENERETAN